MDILQLSLIKMKICMSIGNPILKFFSIFSVLPNVNTYVYPHMCTLVEQFQLWLPAGSMCTTNRKSKGKIWNSCWHNFSKQQQKQQKQ